MDEENISSTRLWPADQLHCKMNCGYCSTAAYYSLDSGNTFPPFNQVSDRHPANLSLSTPTLDTVTSLPSDAPDREYTSSPVQDYAAFEDLPPLYMRVEVLQSSKRNIDLLGIDRRWSDIDIQRAMSTEVNELDLPKSTYPSPH
jgi:hypothetical protein